MIITEQYTLEKDDLRGCIRICSQVTPYCPDCGILLTGYDKRPRKVIDCAGVVQWYLLRRLRCNDCKKIHIEIPDFIIAYKQYNARTINDIVKGVSESCPADNSTIWRWRRENHPPTLQCLSSNDMIEFTQSEFKGEETY